MILNNVSVIYPIHNCTHINKTSQYTHLTKFHKFTAQAQAGVIKRFKHIFVNEHFLTLTNAQQQSLQNADVVTASLQHSAEDADYPNERLLRDYIQSINPYFL